MISVKDNMVSLSNLGVTFNAITNLDDAIAHYSEDKPGPAYLYFKNCPVPEGFQIERGIILVALHRQRHVLIDYLASIGIAWDF